MPASPDAQLAKLARATCRMQQHTLPVVAITDPRALACRARRRRSRERHVPGRANRTADVPGRGAGRAIVDVCAPAPWSS